MHACLSNKGHQTRHACTVMIRKRDNLFHNVFLKEQLHNTVLVLTLVPQLDSTYSGEDTTTFLDVVQTGSDTVFGLSQFN